MVPSGVDEFEMVTEADLRLALPQIMQSGLALLVHAELPSAISDSSGKTWTRYAEYLASRPDESEVEAIELLVRLCREFRCDIHIVHLASAKALDILRSARTEGLPITVETCPHYLFFAAEKIPDGATQHLWDALQSGLIDLVATDHSPCPPNLKMPDTGNFAQAWGGIASLSLAFSAMHTKHPNVQQLVQWMSTAPAKLAGLNLKKGRIDIGCDADFVVFNPEIEFTVTTKDLHFRHPVTPYLNQRLCGKVEQTFVRGNCVYNSGSFIGTLTGRECKV
jgi:allantoinase